MPPPHTHNKAEKKKNRKEKRERKGNEKEEGKKEISLHDDMEKNEANP